MFPLDSSTRGVHFRNLTADVQNDWIRLSGVYEASDLIPVLLFSVGIPWIEPCVKHICCLWDIAARYRDHDLITALGPTCDEGANLTAKDMMKGNSVPDRWSVQTMIHPSFVAMLFLCVEPTFYIFYEIVPMQWIGSSTVHWRSSWYGQPCHQVIYPDGRQVCIYCSNTKPDNAVFVFSANWFATFQCQWTCLPGYVGPNCDVALNLVLYAASGVVAAVCIAGLVLCAGFGPRRKVVVEEEIVLVERLQHKVVARSEMIVFKENSIPDIRIKLL